MAAEQFEPASESFRKALEGATKKMTQAKVNRRFEYAEALFRAGDSQAASKAVEEIKKPEQLFGENPNRFKQLKKELNIK